MFLLVGGGGELDTILRPVKPEVNKDVQSNKPEAIIIKYIHYRQLSIKPY